MIDKLAGNPDSNERSQSKDQHHNVDPILQPGRLNKWCDIGVENVVG
ncbi:hypothetical protein MOK15_19530 [Sphingobium sp. BYY-5]|nr:hypothetical protein [Sphingobium sp. BYY-5]MCI4592273.1 hypothetical protein [Sphingobium sp. BYY-5]